jgi:hypothetical protein
MSQEVISRSVPDVRSRLINATALSVLLCAAATAVVNVRGTDDGPVWRVTAVMLGSCAVLIGIVFGVVLRRTLMKASGPSSARTGLVLGVLGVLSIVVFWMGFPAVFAVGAAVAGLDARDRRPFAGDWQATAAIVLAALTAIGGLVATALG